MKDIVFDEISYAEISTLVAVVQAGSMSKAATMLHVSQPAISNRISSLETKHGIILFIRSGSSLRLTPAGKVFYQEAAASLEHIKAAFIKASTVQESPARTLYVGYDGQLILPWLWEIASRFSKRKPSSRAQFHPFQEEDCMDLFSGKADLLLCPESYFSPFQSLISKEPVVFSHFSILIAEGHPLYEQKTVTIPDLLGVPLTVTHINPRSPYLQAINNIFAKYNISPVIDHLVNRESLAVDLLARQGIAIATPCFWRTHNSITSGFFDDHIRSILINDYPHQISFIWRKDAEDDDIRAFIHTYREIKDIPYLQKMINDSYN